MSVLFRWKHRLCCLLIMPWLRTLQFDFCYFLRLFRIVFIWQSRLMTDKVDRPSTKSTDHQQSRPTINKVKQRSTNSTNNQKTQTAKKLCNFDQKTKKSINQKSQNYSITLVHIVSHSVLFWLNEKVDPSKKHTICATFLIKRKSTNSIKNIN